MDWRGVKFSGRGEAGVGVEARAALVLALVLATDTAVVLGTGHILAMVDVAGGGETTTDTTDTQNTEGVDSLAHVWTKAFDKNRGKSHAWRARARCAPKGKKPNPKRWT